MWIEKGRGGGVHDLSYLLSVAWGALGRYTTTINRVSVSVKVTIKCTTRNESMESDMTKLLRRGTHEQSAAA